MTGENSTLPRAAALMFTACVGTSYRCASAACGVRGECGFDCGMYVSPEACSYVEFVRDASHPERRPVDSARSASVINAPPLPHRPEGLQRPGPGPASCIRHMHRPSSTAPERSPLSPASTPTLNDNAWLIVGRAPRTGQATALSGRWANAQRPFGGGAIRLRTPTSVVR